MDLNQLKERGGFVPSALVEKSVTWTHTLDGEEFADTFTIHVRRLSFGLIERLLIAPVTEDRSRTAEIIAQCVRLGEGGKDAMSYDDAFALDPELAKVLSQAVREVNELGKTTR